MASRITKPQSFIAEFHVAGKRVGRPYRREAGGGKVIVVDADNPGLIGFYIRNGFKGTGVAGDHSLYMKVSTARKALAK